MKKIKEISLDEKTLYSLYKTFRNKNTGINDFFVKLEVLSEIKPQTLKELLKDLEYLAEFHEGGKIFFKKSDVEKMLRKKLG